MSPEAGARTQGGLAAALSAAPIMAILRGLGQKTTVELASRLWDSGVRCIEVPLQSDDDAESLSAVLSLSPPDGAITGAGTILTAPQVERAVSLGAEFVVSPGYSSDVVSRCQDLGVVPLPGVGSASDVQAAAGAGLEWVKAFPATSLGTEWFAAMHAPFPGIRLVATGGIDVQGAAGWLGTPGVGAISLGSALAGPIVDSRALASLIASFRR